MRHSPAVKMMTGVTRNRLGAIATLALLGALSAPAFAQTMTTQNPPPNANMAAIASALGQPGAAGQQQAQGQQQQAYPGLPGFGTIYPPGYTPSGDQGGQDALTQSQLDQLLLDPDSAQYKANDLAERAKRTGDLNNFAKRTVKKDIETVTDRPTPPELDTLQDIHAAHDADVTIADQQIDDENLNLDIRRDAQKEAALSYGARGGLSKRNYQISERLNDYEDVLNSVFNFRALLIKAPAGLLIEPPIVRETLENIFINDDGSEAAVADQVLDINKQSKIVSAPRDWHNYLVAPYQSEIAPPPRVLWPKDKKEQADWNGWVKKGWLAGYEQGEDSFETNLNQLVSDYNGMVRYRTLLAEGKISQPYALHEDRGVTGTKTVMRVGDRALRLTGPSQFLTGSDLWKPADR